MQPELITEVERDPLDMSAYLLALDAPEDWPANLNLGSRHFGLLLVWDATRVLDDPIEALAKVVLAQGAAFVATWGPDCERVHDVFDIADRVPERGDDRRPADSIVMTTWHARDTLDDALWYCLFAAITDDYFTETCRALLICTIGAPTESEHLRRRLDDVDAFDREVLGDDEP